MPAMFCCLRWSRLIFTNPQPMGRHAGPPSVPTAGLCATSTLCVWSLRGLEKLGFHFGGGGEPPKLGGGQEKSSIKTMVKAQKICLSFENGQFFFHHIYGR